MNQSINKFNNDYKNLNKIKKIKNHEFRLRRNFWNKT